MKAKTMNPRENFIAATTCGYSECGFEWVCLQKHLLPILGVEV